MRVNFFFCYKNQPTTLIFDRLQCFLQLLFPFADKYKPFSICGVVPCHIYFCTYFMFIRDLLKIKLKPYQKGNLFNIAFELRYLYGELCIDVLNREKVEKLYVSHK